MAYILPSQPSFQARFKRYECKYLVTESQLDRIRYHIAPYVNVDPHAAGSADNSYNITSLYLDSANLRLFRETREGVLNRIKLRIRCYTHHRDTTAFLEIKRRSNGLVDKGRARLLPGGVETMLKGGVAATENLRGEELACFDEFVGWIGRWLAGPIVWVRYRREAYVGAFQPKIRVTLDRDLVCAPAFGPEMNYHKLDFRAVERRYSILELKFNESFPAWMGDLVRRLALKRISFSKYGNSILRGMGAWYRLPG